MLIHNFLFGSVNNYNFFLFLGNSENQYNFICAFPAPVVIIDPCNRLTNLSTCIRRVHANVVDQTQTHNITNTNTEIQTKLKPWNKKPSVLSQHQLLLLIHVIASQTSLPACGKVMPMLLIKHKHTIFIYHK